MGTPRHSLLKVVFELDFLKLIGFFLICPKHSNRPNIDRGCSVAKIFDRDQGRDIATIPLLTFSRVSSFASSCGKYYMSLKDGFE